MLQARQLEYITLPTQASLASSSSAPPSASSAIAQMMNKLVQYAMNFANDSMHTSLFLQFNAKTIALACVYMSGKCSEVRPTEGKLWSNVLGIEAEAWACK
uniref:Cyclin N-terminal domain-containing protein n=1 Tax=Helicotheca tamesis TaxID=374047 RepID=A0A7S2HT57_9STRA